MATKKKKSEAGASTTSQDAPKKPQGTTKKSNGKPKKSQGTPKKSQDAPKKPQGTTKKSQGKPKKSQGTPKKARAKSASGSLPGTLERSPAKVQRTYEKTLESAEAEYGDEARAHRTAWGSVKNLAEKRGDHWELKESTGPSDPRSTKSAAEKRAGEGETFGGVDVLGNTRDQLVERAKKAGIRGYSRMTKAELGRQLARHE